MSPPRTVLLRHRGSEFDQDVIGRWLAATTDLVGELVIEPDWKRKLETVKHEFRRSGVVGQLDALAFRAYYRIVLAGKEREKIDELIASAKETYQDFYAPEYSVSDPNNRKTREVLRNLSPDLMIARCKVLLDESVYAIPSHGTFVLHPGICPEYRNQHGCFWALANGEEENVGFSLLRIDDGVDTGQVFAQNGTEFSPVSDEHVYIQLKVVADNLPLLEPVLADIVAGSAKPVPTEERTGATWGMPKLSAWKTWKRRVKRFGIDRYDSSTDS